MLTRNREKLLYEDLTYKIRGACFDIWKEFGGAFKEKVVDRALNEELRIRGLDVENQKTRERGFSLLELLVSIAVISILLLVVVTNYRAGDKQLALERSAHKLAQDIRRAQEMAMSARKCTVAICGEEMIPGGGYGVYFESGAPSYCPQFQPTCYILYADTAPQEENEFYTSDDSEVEFINLEKGIRILEIATKDNPSSPFQVRSVSGINFKPPDPTIKIKYQEIGEEASEVKIIIALQSDSNQTRTINVNKAGLIDID